jgi:dTDP-4-amino-4,6-dideoxygalactose transaminase
MSRLTVPFLDLRAQYATLREEVRSAVDRVFEAQAFVLGEEVAALECEVAALVEARRGVGCASGSDALLLVLHALGVGPGDEVICPSFTFFATAGAVARLGARPVFADIDPAGYCLDPASARRAASRCTRLRALLAVHLYGRPADLDALLALSGELGVPLVEDAAQAIGARDASGRRIGARGRAACWSFYPTKNLGAAGDAGMVTTDDDALADRLGRLRVHGSPRRYEHAEVGMNSRLDALQAAVLRVKLKFLPGWTKARRENADRYRMLFAERGLEAVTLPEDRPGHIYNQFVIRSQQRDQLQRFLLERDIGTEVYYPVPLHLQPCFAELGYKKGDLPEAEAAARESLALPIYPELTEDAQRYVVEQVADFLAR